MIDYVSKVDWETLCVIRSGKNLLSVAVIGASKIAGLIIDCANSHLSFIHEYLQELSVLIPNELRQHRYAIRTFHSGFCDVAMLVILVVGLKSGWVKDFANETRRSSIDIVGRLIEVVNRSSHSASCVSFHPRLYPVVLHCDEQTLVECFRSFVGK